MNRIEIIQRLIKKMNACFYLEIGVFKGQCFFPLKVSRKIGVDPSFIIPGRFSLIKRCLQNPCNIFNKYFKMPSDEFFDNQSDFFKNRRIDVAFIDGLHEYRQVIRDVENCLDYLNNQGFIIIHDCTPESEIAATPYDLTGPEHKFAKWTGDVWKAIVYFRSTRDDLNIFVLDCDCGVGIISKGAPENTLDYTVEQIADLTYKDFEKNKDYLINLKPPLYFEKFLNQI